MAAGPALSSPRPGGDRVPEGAPRHRPRPPRAGHRLRGGRAHALLARLGYRAVGIDCAPTAVTDARARHPAADIRLFDFDSDDAARLPHPAFAVITCRLVYRWAAGKPALLSRVRRLLAPGGVFWVVTSVHDPAQGRARSWDAETSEVELLTAGWSKVQVSPLGPSLRCYALRP
ncbi:class I SAM-dependent methyltransferase [Streptomyces sp. NPDC059459]|uniref:class I SAM-dependent methyltransferase n=1 Tax=Streptomyces sp. NPDC059459 TaxID=3346839 RepID=UPI0036761CD9